MIKRDLTFSVYALLLLTVVFFSCVTMDRARADNDFLFNKASEYLAAGRFLEAMGLYQAVADNTASDSEKARAMLLMGSAYHRYLDQPGTALKYFDFVLSRYPATPAAGEAMFNKGMVFYQDRRYAEAYELFIRHPTLYPDTRNSASAAAWAETALNMTGTAGALPSYSSPLPAIAGDTIIRVLIVENEEALTLSGNGPVNLVDQSSSRRVVLNLDRDNHIELSTADGVLLLNGRGIKSGGPFLLNPAGTTLRVNDHRYRGYFTLWVNEEGLSVVNHVNIEHYLYGVVPKEMPWNWPRQALMAQAVAARTYALYVKLRSDDQPYDVKSTTASQVYGGLDVEKATTSRAVDDTRGRILTFQGGLIVAYYHADSGGHTECPENVWGASLPYLKARPDSYSLGVPGSSWHYYLPYAEAGKLLRDYGIDAREVKGLWAGEKTGSGRVREIMIDSDNGRKIIAANHFRLAVGSTRLRSTSFVADVKEDGILFQGTGYGHGVGMSQWGARRMALDGHDYAHILQQYYSGVTIAAIY